MRISAVVRALYGIFLLVAPHTAIRIVTGGSSGRATAIIGQVLGVRHLVQALTVGRTDTRGWLFVGVMVDVSHALSMAAVAARSPNHRRLTVCDAVVAGGWALTGLQSIQHN